MTKTISTDAEALEARRGVPATQGVVILDSLINNLEDCKEYAAKNYGNSLDNKGRFTKRSVRILLADMYLWQGCMLKHGIDKGYILLNEQGDTIKTQSELDTKATANFQRAIELCDEVMKEMQDDYKKEIDKNPNQYTEVEKKQTSIKIQKSLFQGKKQLLIFCFQWHIQNIRIKQNAYFLILNLEL